MAEVLRQFPKHLRRRQRGLCARRHRHRQLQLLGSLQVESARLLHRLRHQLHSHHNAFFSSGSASFADAVTGRTTPAQSVPLLVAHIQRLEVELGKVRAFGEETYNQLQQERQANAPQLEHLLRHFKQNNLVVFGNSESVAYNLPAELARHMQGVLLQTAPASGLTAVRSAYWLVNCKWKQNQLKARAVLVELTSVAAKHIAFQASSRLRADRICLDEDLTP